MVSVCIGGNLFKVSAEDFAWGCRSFGFGHIVRVRDIDAKQLFSIPPLGYNIRLADEHTADIVYIVMAGFTAEHPMEIIKMVNGVGIRLTPRSW